ncbi:MAG TPA: hypothetical protein P5333_14110, partial [Caldilinea sp.]|nr:hypothetical protein [Caldilinea sp.]
VILQRTIGDAVGQVLIGNDQLIEGIEVTLHRAGDDGLFADGCCAQNADLIVAAGSPMIVGVSSASI